jgi:CBS domain-containing protein
MFIKRLLPLARERLAKVMENAPVSQAASLLATRSDLVVVCSAAGLLTGVITRTDIVRHVSEHPTAGAGAGAALSVMTRDVVLCRHNETVESVWERMKARSLKNIPVVEAETRPVGVLHARDLLEVLLKASKDQEAMLRDYVMGVGYR